jgi:hypothetical protein
VNRAQPAALPPARGMVVRAAAAPLCDDRGMVSVARVRMMAIVVTVTLGLAVAGCATTSELPGHGAHSAARPVGQDGPPAAAAKVAVVRGWSTALRAGHLQAAAGYFHLPSLFDDGAGEAVEIHTLLEAETVDSSLSCGSQVISAFDQGRFINVLFRLTTRTGEGAGCGSGVGQTARVLFLIRGGQIVEWLRTNSRAGDPGAPSAPGTPTTSTGTGTGSVI